jgi:nitronate monooxygenase
LIPIHKKLSGFESSKTLRKQLQYICSKLNVAAGIPIPTRVGLLGKMGVLGDPCIPVVLDEPATIWFTFGTDLGKHVEQVQVYDEKREKLHKMLVFVIVNLVKDALHVVNKWKVDVLVIQGPFCVCEEYVQVTHAFNLLAQELKLVDMVAQPHHPS